jgi:hypothetical protein
MADVRRAAWLTELIAVARQMYEVSGGDAGLPDSQRALLDGLAQISRFDLVDRLGEGRADPVPDAVPSAGLDADQARAQAACLAPGVQLIVGPPGTGRSELMAAVLRDLIAEGKSVLLASGTEAAAADAIGPAVSNLDAAPGVVVWAGPPQVTIDPRLCLERMVEDRLDFLDQQRAEVHRQLATLRAHPDVVRLDDARAKLAAFDVAAYREARQRVENDNRLAGLRADMRQVRERAAVSLTELATAQERYGAARRSWEETSLARQHLRAATELDIDLGNVARDCDRVISEVSRLLADRERVSSERRALLGGLAGLAWRRELKRLASEAAELDRRLDLAQARKREAERKLASFSVHVNTQIEAHLHAAEPLTHDAAVRLQIAFAAAEQRFRQAWQVQQEGIQLAHAVDAQIAEVERQPRPTEADFDTLARADEHELERKLAALPELDAQASHVHEEIERLGEREQELAGQLTREGRRVRREIVRQAGVVAISLPMLCVMPELNERGYAHVLIDEAEGASVPEIVYAVSRATEGATLLGDFRPGRAGHAELAAGLADSADPAAQRWLHQDCFALFGLHDTESAQATPGCVVLPAQ